MSRYSNAETLNEVMLVWEETVTGKKKYRMSVLSPTPTLCGRDVEGKDR